MAAQVAPGGSARRSAKVLARAITRCAAFGIANRPASERGPEVCGRNSHGIVFSRTHRCPEETGTARESHFIHDCAGGVSSFAARAYRTGRHCRGVSNRQSKPIGGRAAGRFFCEYAMLRTSLKGDPTARELLTRVREVCLQ